VILRATIDAEGNVVSVAVARSVPMLDDAAVKAVKQWKYTPARKDGRPVEVVLTVSLNFTQ
jgi:protein TonB